MNPTDESKQLAVAESTPAMTKFSADDAREVGLPSPTAINYMMSVAKLICDTALIGNDMGLTNNQILQLRAMNFSPDQIEAKQKEAIRANAFAKMLVGHELNPPIPPMAAQQDIDIVKGKIFLRYPHLIAQMEARGMKFRTIEHSHERAAWEVSDIPGRKEPEIFEFTLEDAKQAGLVRRSKDGDALQYELRPRVMLWARLVSETYRATGGRGGVYVREEKREIMESEEERGDASNAAFAEQGRRNSEAENPFTVTAKTPTEAAKAEAELSKEAPEDTTDRATPAPVTASAAETRLTPPSEPPKRDSATAPEAPKPLTGKKVATKAFQDQQEKRKQEEKTSTYVATEEDVPANIGTPKAAPSPMLMPPGTGSTRVERAGAAEMAIAALVKRDSLSVRRAMADYFRAWFPQGKPLPKVSADESYEMPIRFLQRVSKDDKLAQRLVEDPIKTGLVAYSGWEKLKRYMGEQEWGSDLAKIATTVAVERFPDDGGESLIDFLESVVHPEGPMQDTEVAAFLRMYRHSLHAVALMKAIQEKGKTLVWFLGEFPEFEKVTEGEILSFIAGNVPAKSVQPGQVVDAEWEEEPQQ